MLMSELWGGFIPPQDLLPLILRSTSCVIWHSSAFSPCFPSLMASWQPPFTEIVSDDAYMDQLKGQMHLSDPVSCLCWIFHYFVISRYCSSAVDVPDLSLLLSSTCPVSSNSLRTHDTPSWNMPSFQVNCSLGVSWLLQSMILFLSNCVILGI